MSASLLYFIVLKPLEANRLVAQNGRIILIVPNYTEVFTTLPQITDSALQVFEVELTDKQVKALPNGDKVQTFVWEGDPNGRSCPQFTLQLPIRQVGAVASASPVEVAKNTFSEYPENVQLAAVVASASPDLIKAAVGHDSYAAQLKAWGQDTLEKFLASKG